MSVYRIPSTLSPNQRALPRSTLVTAGILELMDALHQRFCRRFLFVGSFCIPGAAAEDFLVAVKRGNVVFQRVGAFLMDIQPFFAPPLDGVGEFDVEIFDVRADANNNTAYVVGNIVGAITAEDEDALPHRPISLGSEEALAKGDENRNVEDGVGSELMKLQPIHKKQSTKKSWIGAERLRMRWSTKLTRYSIGGDG